MFIITLTQAELSFPHCFLRERRYKKQDSKIANLPDFRCLLIMYFLFVFEFLLTIWIFATQSVSDDIGEGEKTCWLVNHIQKGYENPPMVSKIVKTAFMKLHDTAIDELCKYNQRTKMLNK